MIEKRKMLAIQVTTFNGDEEESHRELDFNSSDAQTWLRKHMYWAVMNGRVIEIMNVKDAGV